jgi:hypothetical protein
MIPYTGKGLKDLIAQIASWAKASKFFHQKAPFVFITSVLGYSLDGDYELVKDFMATIFPSAHAPADVSKDGNMLDDCALSE